MFKILVENGSNLVKYTADTTATGGGQPENIILAPDVAVISRESEFEPGTMRSSIASDLGSQSATLYEVAELPEGFIPNKFTYAAGEFAPVPEGE